MIVIDASSLVKYLLKEENWDKVGPYLRESTVSVDYLVIEAANAIWKEYIIRKQITQSRALKAFQDLTNIKNGVLTLEQFTKYIDDAFDTANKEQISVYDAVYIAQANKRRSALLTSDKNQRDAATSIGIEVKYIP